jgi:hypothetical protein
MVLNIQFGFRLYFGEVKLENSQYILIGNNKQKREFLKNSLELFFLFRSFENVIKITHTFLIIKLFKI